MAVTPSSHDTTPIKNSGMSQDPLLNDTVPPDDVAETDTVLVPVEVKTWVKLVSTVPSPQSTEDTDTPYNGTVNVEVVSVGLTVNTSKGGVELIKLAVIVQLPPAVKLVKPPNPLLSYHESGASNGTFCCTGNVDHVLNRLFKFVGLF